MFDLNGKTAIITGSSRGIGRAIACAMAAQGAQVVISSRKADACQSVAEELNRRFGPGRALASAANISSKDDLQKLVASARMVFGKIDILVCNAAANPYVGPTVAIDDDRFRAILERNLLGTHWLTQFVAPDMVARGAGSIIFIASIGGFMGSPTLGPYGISKAAVMHLARNLAIDLGPRGVRVNCIAPGLVRTDFAKSIVEDAERLREIESHTPLRRIAEPDEIAGAAVFLASPAAAFITGHTLVVDGGVTLGVMA